MTQVCGPDIEENKLPETLRFDTHRLEACHRELLGHATWAAMLATLMLAYTTLDRGQQACMHKVTDAMAAQDHVDMSETGIQNITREINEALEYCNVQAETRERITKVLSVNTQPSDVVHKLMRERVREAFTSFLCKNTPPQTLGMPAIRTLFHRIRRSATEFQHLVLTNRKIHGPLYDKCIQDAVAASVEK